VDVSRLVLIELCKLYPKKKGILLIGTAELGQKLGVSQQTASRYLAVLTRQGYIEKKRLGSGQSIEFTTKGRRELKNLLDQLDRFFKGMGSMQEFSGTLVSGLGEGAYYVRAYAKKIHKLLGFTPYPGTLNLKVKSSLPKRSGFDGEIIPGFTEGERSFGSISLVLGTLKKGKDEVPCVWIIPERTHHIDKMELISPINLRKKLKLKDGDFLKLILHH